VTSNDIRCNVSPGAASAIVDVAPGATVGFNLDNTVYHQGPAAIYLGKAPSSVSSWDGSGASWFKIAEWGATFNPFKFTDEGVSQLTTTIPASTPPGEVSFYLNEASLILILTMNPFSTFFASNKPASMLRVPHNGLFPAPKFAFLVVVVGTRRRFPSLVMFLPLVSLFRQFIRSS
jgi:hypothetical protein